MYTTSTAFLEALHEAGVSFIFANFGSDHPALVEAIAEARAKGRPIPSVVTSPNEMVALCAAHGYAQLTGEPQAVIVHVDCGTQALAGAVHNVDKNRAPVLIFAGLSPFTQDGALTGSRNEFIHWLQDAHDQRGIVRGYTRYDNEIRSGAHVKQLVFRALQIARSDPKGPVYLTGAREVMEEKAPQADLDPARWRPLAPAALADEDATLIARTLAKAKNPLIVTTYLGRKREAVEELVKLCRRLGAGVLESVPSHVNYPATDPLHRGSQWSEPVQNPVLAEADAVLVVDCDVPWIPKFNRPSENAAVFHIDVDPLKSQMPLWYIDAMRSFRADAATALGQINGKLDGMKFSQAAVKTRARRYAAYQGIHVRPVQVEQGAALVHQLRDLLDVHLEEPQRVRQGEHEGRDVRSQRLRQCRDVHVAAAVRRRLRHRIAGHRRRRRVRAVRRGRDHHSPPLLALAP